MRQGSRTPGDSVRVALVTRIFLPEPGAAPLRLGSLVQSLQNRGAHVDVLTTKEPPGFTADDDAGPSVSIRRAPVLRDRAGYVRGYLQYLSFDSLVFFRLLFLPRPDVVVVEPPPTSGLTVRVACALRRIPYVYYAADIWSDAVRSMSSSTFVHWFLRKIEIAAMRGAARVLSASDEFTERLAELGVARNVVTVRNGADLGHFSHEGVHEENSTPYFLYAGTASETQGATIFVDAFERVRQTHPDARLIFVGQGSDWPKLRALSAHFGGSVVVLDRVPPTKVAEWFRGASASLASLRPGEYDLSFPTRMYASVACGTRVIYAGHGPGRGFAAQSHVGWAVEYDSAQLAAVMREALDRPLAAAESEELAGWAHANVSLRKVTDKAADEVLAAVRRRES